MGSGPSYSEESSLFEVRKEESGPVIKTEPVDEGEAFGETQQFGSPEQQPPAQQPSLAAALSNISTASNEVVMNSAVCQPR